MPDIRILIPAFLIAVLLGFVAIFSTQAPPEINIPSGEFSDVITISNPNFVYDSEFVTSHVDARIFEVYSGHAWQQHGTEVNQAFRCLNDKGSSKAFKTFGFTDSQNGNIPTNVWLCFDGTDWYAIVSTAFEKIGGNQVARLVTAYKVSKDLFPTIDEYIKYLVTNWGARAINYAISAGEIFLSPK